MRSPSPSSGERPFGRRRGPGTRTKGISPYALAISPKANDHAYRELGLGGATALAGLAGRGTFAGFRGSVPGRGHLRTHFREYVARLLVELGQSDHRFIIGHHACLDHRLGER